MKKLFQNITIIAVVFVMMFGMLESVQSRGNSQLISAVDFTMPVQQVVVYEKQSVTYDNFSAAIFAQGQLGDVAKLPTGSAVSLYVDANKVNGPLGLHTVETRCTPAQVGTSYYQNTITMDGKFCPDFNDAILDSRPVYGIVPTETVFLHKANGDRCYKTGNGGGSYMTNPASLFLRNYLVNRGSEKLQQLNLATYFLDNLQAGWGNITTNCEGSPREYTNQADYLTQMAGLAQYVHDNLPAYKVEGNLAGATSEWDKFSFLDGAMCESCFTNWGGAWPSASKMFSNLSVIDKWIKDGHKIYVVSQPPDISDASNRFVFAASLLVVNGGNVYFHFGANYGQFYPIPEYKYNLGLPTAERVCSGDICKRKFEHGTVVVDFGKPEGTIILEEVSAVSATPTATISTVIPTLILPTFTAFPSLTATATQQSTALPSVIPPTSTRTMSPTVTLQPTNTIIVTSGTNSLDVRISSGNDDVEENSSGRMYINSSDLELIYDNSAQVIGIRFTGVKIPKGAVITNAYIQFKVDQTSSKTVKLTINGEASPNASAFTDSSRNVSLRPRTKNSVIWSPLAWSKIGEAGKSQQTPDLKSIVQAVVNQSNWNSGNALAFIITGKSGKRVAKSFEGNVAGAPLLHIEFSIPVQSAILLPTATVTATVVPITPSALPTTTTTTIPVTFTLVSEVPTQTLMPLPVEATATDEVIIIPTNTPTPILASTETPIPSTP